MIPVTVVVLRRVFLSFMKLCADVLLSILLAILFPLVLAIGIGGQTRADATNAFLTIKTRHGIIYIYA